MTTVKVFPVKDISQAEMNELFTYEESAKTGSLHWKKVNKSSTAKVGSRAGCLKADKYWYVKVNNITYKLHRVIYTMLKGPIPAGKQINHIDENPSNNKIENLKPEWPIDNSNHGTRNARVAAALSIPIYCHETSTTYPSTKQAARDLKLDAGNICAVLKGKYKQTGNFTFSYVTTNNTTNTTTD